MELTGKSAVITGGLGGIAIATAKKLLEDYGIVVSKTFLIPPQFADRTFFRKCEKKNIFEKKIYRHIATEPTSLLKLVKLKLKNWICFSCKNVALLDLVENEETITALKEAYPNANILFQAVDVSKLDDVERSFQNIIHNFKEINLILSSAGVLDEENADLCIRVNLVSKFF